MERENARKALLNKIKPTSKLDANTVWIGTVSELTGNKGLKYAIKAIKKLKKNIGNEWNGIFVIIGSGEDRVYLENLIEKKELEKDVFLTGFVEDAQKYLKAFDIFLLSSVKEGLPYVLLEAAQAGNAIISTRVGGVEEIIDDQENGILIYPKNKKEIAIALENYIKNPKKANLFGEKIQAKIKKEFTKEKMVKKTLDLYNK